MPDNGKPRASVSASVSRSLAFAGHLRAHVLSDDEVVLLSERDRFALNGRIHAALTPLLDGSHSADEIVAELAGEHSPAHVHLALMRLQGRGLVVDAEPVRVEPAPGARTPKPLPRSTRSPIAMPTCILREVIAFGLPAAWADRLRDIVGEAVVGGDIGGGRSDARPDSGLTICLVDDYLRPELDAAATACREPGDVLLGVRPVGRWLWFGPLVWGPESAPRWKLFDARMRMNRAADVTALERGATLRLFPDDRSPETVELALSIAGRLACCVLAGRPPPALIDGLLTYDTVEATFAHHAIARIAPPRAGAAPAFGQEMPRIELHEARASFSSDGGHRTCPPAQTLARLADLVSPITGIISAVEPVAELGGMHVFAAVHPQAPAATLSRGRRLGRKGGAVGKGFLEDQARASCVGEAVERYSGGFFGDEPRRRARLADIAEIAFHPEDLLLFSDAQYAASAAAADDRAADSVPARFDASQAIEWVAVSSLTSGETRWLPAAYCYYGYGLSEAVGYRGEPYCVADSNGCAAGNTLEEAILQGLMELLERDACGLAWYNRVRRPEIDLDGFEGEPFTAAREAFSARGKELHVLDLRVDTEVPVALAVAWNRDDGLATRFALGCHLAPSIAVSRALSELAQLEIDDPGADAKLGAQPFASMSIRDQPNLMPSSQPPVLARDLPDLTRADIGEELHWCCRMLAGLGHDVLILDQTRPEIDFPTVRVVVPGLRHFWRRLAPGRLYDVPVALGWIPAPLHEEELNPLSVLI